MSNVQPPGRPKLYENFTLLQKVLTGIAGSMFLVACITFVPFVKTFFAPDYLLFLSSLRAGTAGISLLTAAFVGVPNILSMVSWLVKFYEFYNKFKQNHPDQK